jgi:hypothetical protein
LSYQFGTNAADRGVPVLIGAHPLGFDFGLQPWELARRSCFEPLPRLIRQFWRRPVSVSPGLRGCGFSWRIGLPDSLSLGLVASFAFIAGR